MDEEPAWPQCHYRSSVDMDIQSTSRDTDRVVEGHFARNNQSAAEYAARHFGRFLPRKGRQPLRSWSPFFGIFAALNLAVIDTVMGHINAYRDCRLISCYAASLYRASGDDTIEDESNLERSVPVISLTEMDTRSPSGMMKCQVPRPATSRHHEGSRITLIWG